jgi:hypothetical protein
VYGVADDNNNPYRNMIMDVMWMFNHKWRTKCRRD